MLIFKFNFREKKEVKWSEFATETNNYSKINTDLLKQNDWKRLNGHVILSWRFWDFYYISWRQDCCNKYILDGRRGDTRAVHLDYHDKMEVVHNEFEDGKLFLDSRYRSWLKYIQNPDNSRSMQFKSNADLIGGANGTRSQKDSTIYSSISTVSSNSSN